MAPFSKAKHHYRSLPAISGTRQRRKEIPYDTGGETLYASLYELGLQV